MMDELCLEPPERTETGKAKDEVLKLKTTIFGGRPIVYNDIGNVFIEI